MFTVNAISANAGKLPLTCQLRYSAGLRRYGLNPCLNYWQAEEMFWGPGCYNTATGIFPRQKALRPLRRKRGSSNRKEWNNNEGEVQHLIHWWQRCSLSQTGFVFIVKPMRVKGRDSIWTAVGQPYSVLDIKKKKVMFDSIDIRNQRENIAFKCA